MATTRKAPIGNPDEAAAKATTKKAPAQPKSTPEDAKQMLDEVSYQLALDWLLRRNFGGAGLPFGAKQVNRDSSLPQGAKDVLLGRLDLMQ